MLRSALADALAAIATTFANALGEWLATVLTDWLDLLTGRVVYETEEEEEEDE